MARETSTNTLREIRAEGLLSKRRMQVYECVFEHGPMTVVECCKILSSTMDTRSVSPRFTELRNAGVFKEVGTSLCKITNRTVILWDVTKDLPVKVKKPTEHKCPTCKGTGKIIQERLL